MRCKRGRRSEKAAARARRSFTASKGHKGASALNKPARALQRPRELKQRAQAGWTRYFPAFRPHSDFTNSRIFSSVRIQNSLGRPLLAAPIWPSQPCLLARKPSASFAPARCQRRSAGRRWGRSFKDRRNFLDRSPRRFDCQRWDRVVAA